MHISRVFIRNFRNLDYADIPFHDGLNVIVGENGCGKSNLLRAIRLAVDDAIAPRGRRLEGDDFYRRIGPAVPTQVLCSVEFSGFSSDTREQKLEGLLKHNCDVPRVTFRFRPGTKARTALESDKPPLSLLITDYTVERRVGGVKDPKDVLWSEDYGAALVEGTLDDFTVVEVPALRDVVDDLRNYRSSPLIQLLDEIQFSVDTQDALVAALRKANTDIEDTQHFKDLALAIGRSYRELAANLSDLNVTLGFSDPSFTSILRNLSLLVSDELLSQSFDLPRNGLGFNNLLYIAMLVRLFEERRVKKEGPQLILIEEPEAHLHPQAQEALTKLFTATTYQSIFTTHSAHVVVSASIKSTLCLQRGKTIKPVRLSEDAGLSVTEIDDIERYMDVTRSSLLFAKSVLLVEGPAEQLLIREYSRVLGKDLVDFGVQVVAVNGTHFDAFEKLLGSAGAGRPYVILTDGDAFRDDARNPMVVFDDGTNQSKVAGRCSNITTLEYAITQRNSLPALYETAKILGRKKLMAQLGPGLEKASQLTDPELADLQLYVYIASVDEGKARFAQTFAREIKRQAVFPPTYIADAIKQVIDAQQTAAASSSD